MREYVWLECTGCGDRNYRVQKETRGANRLELKKYCRRSASTRRTKKRERSSGVVQTESCCLRYERSSTGRAPVSKTGGWGFDSLRSCYREAECRGRWRRAMRVFRIGGSSGLGSAILIEYRLAEPVRRA